jgi:hypothetical protein
MNVNNFIGSTHLDALKTISNLISSSNYGSSNYTSNCSNILNSNSSNYTSNCSNILNSISSNYTNITSNIIQTNINKLIKEEIEHITLPTPADLNHTYIYNSNIASEIRFWCKSTADYPVINPLNVPDYRVKIGPNGHLMSYYTYDPLINLTFGNGWIDIANSIVALNAADANFTITVTGLQAEILNNYNLLESQIRALVFALEDYTLMTQSQRIQIMQRLDNELSAVRIGQQSMPLALASIRESFLTGLPQYFTQGITVITAIINNNPFTATFLGLGGAAFFYIANKIYEQEYNTITLGLISSNVKYMPDITETRRSELFNDIFEEKIKSYVNITSNEYYINLTQGFINTNIQDIQYIPNLSTSNLYINTGNLNKIVSSSSIVENGAILSSKYLTSNHLYNLISNYSIERQYPSKLYNTASVEDTATIVGKLSYHQILYLDNSGVSYGSGFYEVFSSSTYDTPTSKNKLFNFDTTETTNSAQWGISLYNSGSGNYQGDNSIDAVYYGDWVILKMPQPIMLTRYRIYQNTQFPNRSPSEWKVYGSNDGITFTPIAEAHQLTRLLASDYTFYYYNKALAATFTTQYQYFGFVFGKLLSVSGETTLNFAELQIFGKEIISNSINSNIYTTSNAVKGIVEFEMPIVCKHKAFYCQTSSIIYPDSGTTPYYKYDIDMRNYTQTGYIQIGSQSNDPYRIFRIRAFLGSCYFSSIKNGLPDILHYEIYMSNKAQAASGGQGAAGVNIYAIGYPNNPTLNITPPNNIFILSNPFNDFNYITLVSTSPADIRVIIEDLIS